MNTTTTPQTNRYGFPLAPCGRCGGTGHYSSYKGDTTCFDCGGSGVMVQRGAASKAYAAFVAAVPRRSATVAALQVGQRFLFTSKAIGEKWLTVERIEVTPLRCGSSLIGTNEADRIHLYYMAVTARHADGRTETRVLSENQLLRRQVTADMVPNPRDYWPAP